MSYNETEKREKFEKHMELLTRLYMADEITAVNYIPIGLCIIMSLAILALMPMLLLQGYPIYSWPILLEVIGGFGGLGLSIYGLWNDPRWAEEEKRDIIRKLHEL